MPGSVPSLRKCLTFVAYFKFFSFLTVKYSDESETNIRKGKITLEKVQEMVATHRADQEKNTPRVLAQFYNLDLGKFIRFWNIQVEAAK